MNGLMGSVSTKLLRKENPSQGSHFTFYFYCMWTIFLCCFYRRPEEGPKGARENRERTFLTACKYDIKSGATSYTVMIL